MVKVAGNLLQSDTQYFEFLTNSTIDYIAQVVEEAVIYAHQDAQSNSSNKLHEFMQLALDIFEKTLCHKYIEFSPGMHENLSKIQKRIQKIIKKKENPLMANFTVLAPVEQAEEETDFYDLDDLLELKELSPSFAKIAIRVSNLTQRALAVSNLVKQEHLANPNFKNYEYRPGAMPSSNQTTYYAE